MTSSGGSSLCVCRALVLLPGTGHICSLCQPHGTADTVQPQINSRDLAALQTYQSFSHTRAFASPFCLPMSPLIQTEFYTTIVCVLHLETTRNLPAEKHTGFIACCNEGEHSLEHCGCLSKEVSRKGLAGLDLFFV